MNSEERVSADQLASVLRNRRTIGRFVDREVSPNLIDAAIEVARWAPNHRLTEPWYFYRLGPQAVEATIERVGELGARGRTPEMGRRKAKRAEGVPEWVVVTSRTNNDPIVEREDYAATSCAIHNFSLYLWQEGIGMKWCTGALSEDQIYYDRLGINRDDETIVGILRIGYPVNLPSQQRKDVHEITTQLP